MIFLNKYFLFISIVLTFGCSNSSNKKHKPNSYGGTLRINERSQIITLFPHSVKDIVSSHIISQLYDGLVKFNAYDLSVKPAIAMNWEIDSTETVYRFYLNTNVFFNDNECFANGIGRKVTANDFVYTFTLLATKNDNNLNFFGTIDKIVGATDFYFSDTLNNDLGRISGIKAENDSVLVICLEKPNPLFLYSLASPAAAVIPREAFEKYGYKSYVGAGPFYINNYATGNEPLVLLRNPNYYQKDNSNNFMPYLDTVIFNFNGSSKSELQMLSEDKLDLLYNVDNTNVTVYLEKNIQQFKGNKPKFVLQMSNLSNNVQLQHIIKRNLKGFITNSQNYFDLSKVYYESEKKDTLLTKK
jgi:peptide/nickel transport system substrate-binding protein